MSVSLLQGARAQSSFWARDSELVKTVAEPDAVKEVLEEVLGPKTSYSQLASISRKRWEELERRTTNQRAGARRFLVREEDPKRSKQANGSDSAVKKAVSNTKIRRRKGAKGKEPAHSLGQATWLDDQQHAQLDEIADEPPQRQPSPPPLPRQEEVEDDKGSKIHRNRQQRLPNSSEKTRRKPGRPRKPQRPQQRQQRRQRQEEQESPYEVPRPNDTRYGLRKSRKLTEAGRNQQF